MPEHQQTQQSRESKPTFQKQTALASQNSISHPASIIQRARINPKSLTSADVLQLQRTIGNRAVGRLLSEIRNTSKVQQAPIQRQKLEEEEPLQGKFETIQRLKPEEEEPLQGKMSETIQRLEPEEEEKLQMKSVVQSKESPEDDEPLQGVFENNPEQAACPSCIQRKELEEEEPLQTKRENNTGMPDNLKAGVENLSGIDMSDVRVHYNSAKPAEMGALAYTQGTNIHVASGQEKYLPHEAWHVVQQAQGRVKPTIQIKGLSVNDAKDLEREANVMGASAIQMKFLSSIPIQMVKYKCKHCGAEYDDQNALPPSIPCEKGKTHDFQPAEELKRKVPFFSPIIPPSIRPCRASVLGTPVASTTLIASTTTTNLPAINLDIDSVRDDVSEEIVTMQEGHVTNPFTALIGMLRNPGFLPIRESILSYLRLRDLPSLVLVAHQGLDLVPVLRRERERILREIDNPYKLPENLIMHIHGVIGEIEDIKGKISDKEVQEIPKAYIYILSKLLQSKPSESDINTFESDFSTLSALREQTKDSIEIKIPALIPILDHTFELFKKFISSCHIRAKYSQRVNYLKLIQSLEQRAQTQQQEARHQEKPEGGDPPQMKRENNTSMPNNLKDGVGVNDDQGLEKEADLMGGEALSVGKLVVQRIEGEGNDKRSLASFIETEVDVMGAKALSLGKATQAAFLLHPIQTQSCPQAEAIQRVAWHEVVPANALTAFNSVTNTGTTAQISVSGYNFTAPQYSAVEQKGKDKVDVIANIAEQISQITHPPSSEFLSKSQLQTTLHVGTSIPLAGLPAAMPIVAHRNIYTHHIDPHVIRVPGETAEGIQIALHYQFGKDSYGYIVKIEQEGKAYIMHEEPGQDALVAKQLPMLKKHRHDDPLMDRFASAHDTDDANERIADVASKSTTCDELRLYDKNRDQSQEENIEKLREKSKRLDSVAKIGGEGARWDCVRELGRSGKLANSSKFYCSDPDSYLTYIGISFQNLWSVWSTWFDMNFGIDDGTVVSKLIEKRREGNDLIEEMNRQELTEADYDLEE